MIITTIIVQYTITVRAITVRGNTEDFTCGRAVSFEIGQNFRSNFFSKFPKKNIPKDRKQRKLKMNSVRGTSIYLRRPGSLESKRNDWWRDNEWFSVQVSTQIHFFRPMVLFFRSPAIDFKLCPGENQESLKWIVKLMLWARPLIGQIFIYFNLIGCESHLASINLKTSSAILCEAVKIYYFFMRKPRIRDKFWNLDLDLGLGKDDP